MRFLVKISLYANFGQKWVEYAQKVSFLPQKWGKAPQSAPTFLRSVNGQKYNHMQIPVKIKDTQQKVECLIYAFSRQNLLYAIFRQN